MNISRLFDPRLVALSAVVALVALWLLSPLQRERVVLAPKNETARYHFGGTVVLAQEFVPPRGLKRITIPIGSEALPSGPLLLHVREELFGEDVRTSTVFALREDGQDVQFSFAPLLAPPPKLLWVLEAPHTPSGRMWVYREHDAAVFTEGRAFKNDRPVKGNFSFSLTYYELAFQHAFDFFIATQSWERYSFFVGLVGALLARAGASGIRSMLARYSKELFAGIAALSVVVHFAFIVRYPLVNDEGAYIQDVLQMKFHFLPFRDFLTKGPLYLVLLKAWQLLAPHTIMGWRLLSSVSWGVAVYLLPRLMKVLSFSSPAQLFSAVLMAFLPAAVSLTTPLLLQNTSVPFCIGALYTLAVGFKYRRDRLVVAAALLMACAFFIRISSGVVMLVGIASIFLFERTRRWQTLLLYGGTFAGALLFIFGMSWATLGLEKTAVLFNLEAFLISHARSAAAAGPTDSLVRRVLVNSMVLWRGAPLLLGGVLLAPLFTVRGRRGTAALFVVGVSLMIFVVRHLADMDYLLPRRFPFAEMTILGLVVFIPLLLLSLRSALSLGVSLSSESRRALALCAVWVGGLLVLYGRWGRFRHSYIVEFLPPLVIVASWALHVAWRQWNTLPSLRLRWIGGVAALTLAGASIVQGMALVYVYPHTGNIDQGELSAIVSLIRQHVPPHEPLFTAQPVVTAFAERPIIFGYSHPGWYREERFNIVSPALRALLFRDPEYVTDYLNVEARYVLNDVRTDEIYFDGYPERQHILTERFVELGRVDNSLTGVPFVLYQRKE